MACLSCPEGNQTYGEGSDSCYIAIDECVEITLVDSFGDGWNEFELSLVDAANENVVLHTLGYDYPGHDVVSHSKTETVCLETRRCYRGVAAGGPDEVAGEISWKVTNGVEELTSAVSTESAYFCIGVSCSSGEELDKVTGRCRLCDTGSYVPAGESVSRLCPYSTFSDKKGSVECNTCDSFISSSHIGSTSSDQCFALNEELFVTTDNNVILGYNQEKSAFDVALHNDGHLDSPRDIFFISPYVFLIVNYHGHNL